MCIRDRFWGRVGDAMYLRPEPASKPMKTFLQKNGAGHSFGQTRAALGRFLCHEVLRIAQLLIVIAACAMAGVEADCERHNCQNEESWVGPLGVVMATLMLVDTLGMIAVFGEAYLSECVNCADCVIVMLNFCVYVLKEASDYMSEDLNTVDSDGQSLGSLLRALLALPVLRLMFALTPLSGLINTFLCGVNAVAWLAVMVLLVLYFFSVSLTAVIAHNVHYLGDAAVQSQYGSTAKTMWTLVTTCLDFPTNSSSLSQIDGIWVMFFAFYLVTFIGALNLVIGILCEALAQNGENEQAIQTDVRDEQIQALKQELTGIFKSFASTSSSQSDPMWNGHTQVTVQEMTAFLQGEDGVEGALAEGSPLQRLLQDSGVDPSEVVSSLKLLPCVDGTISTEHFLEEVFRLNRPTTQMDLLKLQKKILKKQDQVLAFATDSRVQALEARCEALEHTLALREQDLGYLRELLKHKDTQHIQAAQRMEAKLDKNLRHRQEQEAAPEGNGQYEATVHPDQVQL
eukprot:TRINITY_DN10403_c0_g1_i2.p1 TRINITY_DN10403_c0_g1~~TRINITY_DN10403_c0_g1_i2.p1  ORF type:complete len:514 (-),score=185.53 TRINITY_DN10403_c0_g1_i2:69-1610(-)